jgi:hypothetical protein
MYMVKKYIRAVSALDAIRKEKTKSVDEVSIDLAWKDLFLSEQMGFEDPYNEKEE